MGKAVKTQLQTNTKKGRDSIPPYN